MTTASHPQHFLFRHGDENEGDEGDPKKKRWIAKKPREPGAVKPLKRGKGSPMLPAGLP